MAMESREKYKTGARRFDEDHEVVVSKDAHAVASWDTW